MSNLLSRVLKLEQRFAGMLGADARTSKVLPDGRMLFDIYSGPTRVAHDVPEAATRHCASVLIDPDPDV